MPSYRIFHERCLPNSSKELEEEGLLERVAYKELPPRVDYFLYEKGLAFLPILESIKVWQGKYGVIPAVDSEG